MKKHIFLVAVATTLALSACSSNDSSETSSFDLDFSDILPVDSEAVSLVKGGTIKACPLSTLGDMADAFLSNPEWSDFTATTGETVVELTGGMTYDGMPVTARMQFDTNVPLGTFEVGYLEIGGVGQNLLVTSALLTKMCEAT